MLILAVGISGIQQLGGAFFVEPLVQWHDAGHLDRARRLRAAPAQRRASGAGLNRDAKDDSEKDPGLNDRFAFRMDGASRRDGKRGATGLTGHEPAVM